MRKVQQHTFLKVYAYDARSFMYMMHIPQHVIATCVCARSDVHPFRFSVHVFITLFFHFYAIA